jgi:hypothetical protein
MLRVTSRDWPFECLLYGIQRGGKAEAYLTIWSKLAQLLSGRQPRPLGGRTLLHKAVSLGLAPVVLQRLLDSGAPHAPLLRGRIILLSFSPMSPFTGLRLSTKDDLGRTALCEVLTADVKDPVPLLRHLLDMGARLQTLDQGGCNILHLICVRRRLHAPELAREVLQRSPSLASQKDARGRLPLAYACMPMLGEEEASLAMFPPTDAIVDCRQQLKAQLEGEGPPGPLSLRVKHSAQALVTELLPFTSEEDRLSTDVFGMVR